MSMNLHVMGIREVVVVNTGKHEMQIIDFDLYQTPTKVTRELLSSNDIAQAYRDWILKDKITYEDPIYADDDFFREGEIIGYKTVCDEEEHIKKFDKFIEESKEEGYEIRFYEL